MNRNYENAIEIKDLCKNYSTFSLKNINFTLPKGFIMGFIGPNGAGKTTTIKAIMGLLKTDSGSINIFDKTLSQDEIKIKNRIGFVYDDCYFYTDLSIEDNKKIIAPFYTNWDDSKFNFYITKFKLNPKQKIKELSKGMKMRFSLAIALSHKAELIIMDEPTSGLDPVFRSDLLDLLFELIQKEELSILFSTHITTDLERIADYITFINNGKIVFTKEKDVALTSYKVVKGPINSLTSDLESKLIGIRKNKYNFEALTSEFILLEKNYKNELIFERATLDDIMVYYVKEEGGFYA